MKDKQPLALTFVSLAEAVETYAAATAEQPASRLERWLFAIGLFAAGVGSLVATLIGGPWGLKIIWLALAVEVVGLGGAFLLMIKRSWISFRHSHRAFAKELDHDFGVLERLLALLMAYPIAELNRMRRYVRRRRDSMAYRTSLISGGIERLGLLPVLGALYVQFKDWEFGDWNALGEINLVGGLLLWALLLIYLMSWYLIRLRIHLDVYDFLLEEALQARQVLDGNNQGARASQ